jgi:NADH-quinone oxidoreductase subunit E
VSALSQLKEGVRAEKERASLPRTPASVIPLLQQVQEDEGFVSEDAIEWVARYTGSPSSAIYGVVTFYSQFRLNRPGRHMIRVCEGTACHVLGIAAVLDRLTEELGVQVGGTTADGLFTLESVRCLGCCSLAPTVMIDEETHGRVTPDSVVKILAPYREEAS